jgi:hypothetical protein
MSGHYCETCEGPGNEFCAGPRASCDKDLGCDGGNPGEHLPDCVDRRNDELLAALEEIANHVTKSDTWELKRIARDAIAKARGSK